MSENRSVEFAKKVVEAGFKKYNTAGSYLSPETLKSLVQSYAFDALYNECDANQSKTCDIDFHTFSECIKKAIDAKFRIHLENPIS